MLCWSSSPGLLILDHPTDQAASRRGAQAAAAAAFLDEAD
jgi:hypothetical protein